MGQYGRNWVAAPGESLTATMILYPLSVPPTEVWKLTILAGLAVAQTLQELGIQNLTLKWPNDIYIDDRKCGGILCQSSILGQKLDWAVVGIGLNVRQREFPKDLPLAISLYQHTGIDFSICEISNLLSERLCTLYSDWVQGRIPDLLAQYEQWLWCNRQHIKIQELNPPRHLTGILQGITTEGHLLVELGGENGSSQMQSYPHGSIQYQKTSA